jgi:hypothetical protein
MDKEPKKVSISTQVFLAFIPFANLWAFWRIKKLGYGIAVNVISNVVFYAIFIGAIAIGASIEQEPEKLDTGYIQMVNPSDLNPLSTSELGYGLGYLIGFPVSIAIPVYSMYRWSKQWNKQFQTNESEF